MSIKSVISEYEKIKDAPHSISEEQLSFLALEMNENCEKALKFILEKVSEKDMIKYLRMVQTLTVSIMASQGKGEILIAEVSGVLDGYTHTAVLAVIGGLIQDEIL